jgi:hypothetical protein
MSVCIDECCTLKMAADAGAGCRERLLVTRL